VKVIACIEDKATINTILEHIPKSKVKLLISGPRAPPLYWQ
jgi:hypothetical protein